MILGQALRFCAVGLFNTFIGLAVIFTLKHFAGMGDVLANGLGYAIGLVVSYKLTSSWTFSYQGAQRRSLVRFAVAMVFSYGLNLLTVLLAIHAWGVEPYLAQAMGTPPFTISSFILGKYWVFKTEAV
jgi:putative flippase GtrA